jgi:hypothetical protein
MGCNWDIKERKTMITGYTGLIINLYLFPGPEEYAQVQPIYFPETPHLISEALVPQDSWR